MGTKKRFIVLSCAVVLCLCISIRRSATQHITFSGNTCVSDLARERVNSILSNYFAHRAYPSQLLSKRMYQALPCLDTFVFSKTSPYTTHVSMATTKPVARCIDSVSGRVRVLFSSGNLCEPLLLHDAALVLPELVVHYGSIDDIMVNERAAIAAFIELVSDYVFKNYRVEMYNITHFVASNDSMRLIISPLTTTKAHIKALAKVLQEVGSDKPVSKNFTQKIFDLRFPRCVISKSNTKGRMQS